MMKRLTALISAIGCVALAGTASGYSTTVPGSLAHAYNASDVSCFSRNYSRVTNTCSSLRWVTLGVPTDNISGNRVVSAQVHANESSSCRAVGVRSDNGWLWTQGWVYPPSLSGSPVQAHALSLSTVSSPTYVPSSGSLVVQCRLNQNHGLNASAATY